MVTQTAAPVRKRLFTTREYHQMVAAGILTKDDRVELIKGEIVAMSPIGPHHSGIVNRLVRILVPQQENRMLASIQNAVQLDQFSQPEPDLAFLKPRADDYVDSHPTPDDVYLLIEVADSSLAFDRDVKADLYAEAGIPEYWLIDLVNNAFLVYRQPSPEGYRRRQKIVAGETVSPQAFPDIRLNVSDILR